MNKKIKILSGFALIFACLGAVLLTVSPIYAEESKKVTIKPIGTPVSDDQGKQEIPKETLESLKCTKDDKDCYNGYKCKAGTEGCAISAFSCGPGHERKVYAGAQSECDIRKNDVDSKGQEKTTMYYLNIVINVVLGVMGVVSVVMIILGGINYTTSQGDPTKAGKAQKTIIFSIVGLVVALLAFAIVNFVLTNVFKG